MRTDVPVTSTSVLRALVENHGFSREDADAAIKKAAGPIAQANKMGSYVNYVLDEVFDVIGHECTDKCTEGEDED